MESYGTFVYKCWSPEPEVPRAPNPGGPATLTDVFLKSCVTWL